MKLLALILAVIIPLQLSAQESTLNIHGSNTVGARLMPALVYSWLSEEGFNIRSDQQLAEHHRVISAAQGNAILNVDIQSHGSSTGFQSLSESKADLSMSSRPIKAREISQLKTFGDLSSSEKEVVIGVDGIAVIVHPANPIAEMSIDQVRQVFSGEISNWQQLGAPAQNIKRFSRDSHSGTYDSFKALVLGKQRNMSHQSQIVPSNSEMVEIVRATPGAIGFVSLASVEDSKVLAVSDGTKGAFTPDQLSIGTEDYPLSRRLYLYAPYQAERPWANKFSQFIKTPAGQDIVERAGFISQNISVYEKLLTDDYPSDYRMLLADAKRLSLNFRFKKGEYELDNKAMQDIERLVKYVKDNQVGQVILAGFSDGAEETPWRRHLLSTERGDFVAEALIKRGVVPSVVRGFDSAIQVANNDTEEGRSKNRRVEVWMKYESYRASAEKRKRLTQQKAAEQAAANAG